MGSNIPRRDHQRRQARQRKPHNHHHKARPYESRHDCRSSDSIRFDSVRFNSTRFQPNQYSANPSCNQPKSQLACQHSTKSSSSSSKRQRWKTRSQTCVQKEVDTRETRLVLSTNGQEKKKKKAKRMYTEQNARRTERDRMSGRYSAFEAG